MNETINEVVEKKGKRTQPATERERNSKRGGRGEINSTHTERHKVIILTMQNSIESIGGIFL